MANTALSAETRAGFWRFVKYLQHNFSTGGRYAET